MDDFLSQDSAAFNMGADTLTRINYQLWHCNGARTEGSIEAWWPALVNIYVEVNPYLNDTKKDPEKLIHEEFYKKGEEAYSKFNLYNKNYQRSSQYNKHVQYIPPREAYDLFMKWELELRSSMDKHGLLMKKADTVMGAMA